MHLTLKLHSYTMGNRLDTPCPDLLIQFRIQPDIARAHGLLRKVNDRFDGPWSPLFEGSTVYTFMEVNCILAGDDVLESRARLTAGLESILC